ncbi:hypothetical protein MUGA111182_18460 [Mucilaginibacter galii]|uniref:Aspartyl protease n=1 Tax=Mucilaginibacter galii TaxID=2005073 RepID=A0A917J8U6_9SPHI|nr:hypothetical protein [Mucilaginibacter galii]GGI51265.1 hypothetical protein GCM10011425_24770 [Mucilaginibacter galii]
MKYSFFILLSFLIQLASAQTKLPVIKATSRNVNINDGRIFEKNAWGLSPEIKPDVYTADRTRKTKWVTFYTDIDSIRVKVKPGSKTNFVVLLNGKDSCFTQIASAIPPESKSSGIITHDTIPFTLTAYNAIKLMGIINNTDTLSFHFDISSFGFHITRDALLDRTQLVANKADVLAGKAKANYNKLNKVSKLQFANTVWNNPTILPSNLTAHEMDGRIGWTVFEGKQVEVDYDRSLLIVHSKPVKVPKGYVKAPIVFIRSLPCIKGTFDIQNKKYTGYFAMDTGSEQALILDSTWRARQNFPTNLPLINSFTVRDANGNKYETKMVIAPKLTFNNSTFTNIPTLLTGTITNANSEINFLGNDFFKRFNTILDFKNDVIYLKPNKLKNVKYRVNS